MSNFEKLAPMFAGSANSLKSFEAWTMGFKEVQRLLSFSLYALTVPRYLDRRSPPERPPFN